MNRAAILSAVVVFASFLAVSACGSCSDSSDASPLPTVDVLRTSDGSSLSGTSSILEDAHLDVTVNSDRYSKTYVVSEGTVLTSGEAYLLISGPSSVQYSLTGSTFGMSTYDRVFGLRLSLYTSQACLGDPVCSFAFYDQNTHILKEGLESCCRYYIEVTVDSDASFDTVPYIDLVGFDLTVSTPSDYNAVYFTSEGVVCGSDLVRNGDQYEFPEVSREGYDLIGWYDAETGGRCYSNGDPVDQDSDMTLYAHWSQQSEDHVHYVLPDNSEVFIDKGVSEGFATVSIRSFSEDGRVTTDTGTVRMSELSDVVYVLHLSSDSDVFSSNDASHCAAMKSAVDGWLDRQHLYVASHLSTRCTGEVVCDAEALGTVSAARLNFELTNTVSKASAVFSCSALSSISASCGVVSQCTFVIRESAASDLTQKQKETIGGSTAWVVAVICDGREIHDLGTGTVSASFPYELPSGRVNPKVCRVSDDGSREDVVSSYSGGGSIGVTLTHLSVYMPYDEKAHSWTWFWVVILIVAASIMTYIKVVKVDHGKKNS